MTTIAWRSPFMVSDGRVTWDNIIVTDRCVKISRLTGGGLMGFAGAADTDEVRELFDRVKTGRTLPTRKQILECHTDFRAILALPDGSSWCVESGPDYTDEDGTKQKNVWNAAVFPIHDDYFSVGSGSKWAKAAMDTGATAERAVRVALKNDAASGGKVQVFELQLRRRRKA